MRVAVPLFGQDVAPRFGFANTFLVAEIEDSRVLGTKLVSIETGSWANRLSNLESLGIKVLLCGGFNRAFTPLAEDLGIDIHAGLTGDAHQVVEAFARGEAMPTFTCIGLGRRKSLGQKRPKGRRIRRRGRNSHPQ